jgi:2-dehydropantoate 2-reductase
VHELGTRLGIATPNVDALVGLARLYGRVHGLYPNG